MSNASLEGKQQIFIVVCRDRHVDLGLSVHLSREGADAAITAFQAIYEDEDYMWTEDNWGTSKWVRHVSTGEGDGPSAYIEISAILE